MINLISYRCSTWCNCMDNFLSSYFLIYLMNQSAPHWWGIFFTQQTSCLPYVLLICSSWYIGIYTVDTLLYLVHFTNCIIPFLPLFSYHPQVFAWVLQPELTLKVITTHFIQTSGSCLLTVEIQPVTNFIQSYLHQFFNYSHSLKASLNPLRRPFDRYQSCLEAINNGRDIRQINW